MASSAGARGRLDGPKSGPRGGVAVTEALFGLQPGNQVLAPQSGGYLT